MQKFNFELTDEESEHVHIALFKTLQNNLESIQEVLASDKEIDLKRNEIKWYIDNSEWFANIMKTMGFDPNFDETIIKMRKMHNLTNNDLSYNTQENR